MANFITLHLVGKILEIVRDKQRSLKHDDGFLYFNEVIDAGIVRINRINSYFPYGKEQIVPTSLNTLKGDALMDIYNKLNCNEFYIYKKIDGRDCKVRLKFIPRVIKE